MTSRASISGGLSSAIRFLAPAWRQAWAAIGLASLVLGFILALRLWSPLSPWRFEGLLLAVIAVLIVEGGLYRLALGKGRLGAGGLGWGLTQWRLGAVWGLNVVFLFVLGLLAFVVILAFAFAVASSGQGFVLALPMTWARGVDSRSRLVVEVVGALCLAGLIWAGTRVSLGSAASVAGDRIQMLSSWPDTRGKVVAILLTHLCLGAVPIGFAGSMLMITEKTSGLAPALVWVVSIAAGGAIAGLWLPLSVGLMAYFYQRRTISFPQS